MATANPFASLLSGLGLQMPGSTSASTSNPKNSYISSLVSSTTKKKQEPLNGQMSVYKPQPNMSVAPTNTYSAKTVSPLTGSTAAQNAYNTATGKNNTNNAPYTAYSPTGAPYSTTAALQASVKPQPNMTSAITGKPAYGGTYNVPPPTTKNSSSAKDAFIASSAPRSSNAIETSSFGGTDFNFDNSSATTPSSSSSSGSFVGSGTSAGVGAGSGDYRKAYTDLLSSLYSTKDIASANESLDELNKRMAKAKLFQREEERNIKKNEQGALARGVNYNLQENSRKSAAELADLSIAAQPYQDYVTGATNAYKALADMQPNADPFTLSDGQTRYDAQGNVIAGGSQGGSSYSVGSPEVNAWAQLVRSDPARLAQVPEELRTAVAQAIQGLPASQNPEVQQAIQKASVMLGQNGQPGAIDEALAQVGALTSGLAGKTSAGIAGTPAYNLERALDVIKSNLGFQELAAMRAASPTGGALGSITERELQFLQSTVASLDIGQDAKTLKKNLEKVREHYKNWVTAVQQANSGGGGQGGSGGIWDF